MSSKIDSTSNPLGLSTKTPVHEANRTVLRKKKCPDPTLIILPFSDQKNAETPKEPSSPHVRKIIYKSKPNKVSESTQSSTPEERTQALEFLRNFLSAKPYLNSYFNQNK